MAKWWLGATQLLLTCVWADPWNWDVVFFYITGKLQHVYTELPFTTAICAMAYHPTEHMLAISAFGSHQPLVVCTHISNGAETNNHTLSTTVVEPGTGKETGIMKQDSMILQLNQRLREVTKTLNRATRPAAEGREIRKKWGFFCVKKKLIPVFKFLMTLFL